MAHIYTYTYKRNAHSDRLQSHGTPITFCPAPVLFSIPPYLWKHSHLISLSFMSFPWIRVHGLRTASDVSNSTAFSFDCACINARQILAIDKWGWFKAHADTLWVLPRLLAYILINICLLAFLLGAPFSLSTGAVAMMAAIYQFVEFAGPPADIHA